MTKERQFFRDLLLIPSPSGLEEKAINLWNTECSKLGLTSVYSDKIGNSVFSLGHGETKILLSGHVDVLSSRVTYIDDDGYISFINTGGMCLKTLISSHIQILTDTGIVDGVVVKKALHLETDEEMDSVGEWKDYKISVGAENKRGVEALGIYPGCVIVYRPECNLNFGPNKMCATGLDDKAAVFMNYLVAKNLIDNPNKTWEDIYTVYFGAFTQEETGCRGAWVAANNLDVDISIDSDVTFADGPVGMDKERFGDIKLGKGGVIEYGCDKSPRIAKILKEFAPINGSRKLYQTAASRNGGTNTDAIQLESRDCETMLLSIPLLGMHSSVEICDWRDINSCVTMLSESIRSMKL